MAVPLQLLILLIFAAGPGWWIWRALRRPAGGRAFTWLWFGLAGLGVQALALQAFIYFDLPLRRTVPAMFVLAVVGVVLLIRQLWRTGLMRRRRRQVGIVVFAGLVAGAVPATVLSRVESDRYLGLAQIDQLNYVTTAQFLTDLPYSTEFDAIGLRPWLFRPIDLKHERITEFVWLGEVAVITRTDCQRVWAATVIFATVLLGMAVAASAQVALRLPAGWACAAGILAGVIPATTNTQHMGFFSQLVTLWVIPGLWAVLRPGAFAPRVAGALAATMLAFLAGAYTEFFPLGAAVAGLLMLAGPGTVAHRFGRIAVVFGTAFILLTGYVANFVSFLITQSEMATRRGGLNGFAPDAGTWLGWGRYFVLGPPAVSLVAGALVLGALGLAVALLPKRRRWWVACVLLPALVLGLYLRLSPQFPAYAFHKLGVQMCPVIVLMATGGAALTWRRLRGPARGLVLVPALALAGGATASSLQLNRALAEEFGQPVDVLWAARQRAESAGPGQAFLVGGHNGFTGGWLAYFARNSPAYYLQPIIADRRVPSEALSFRKIPAGVPLLWLDPGRSGPVQEIEPSPTLEIVAPAQRLTLNHQPAFVLQGETSLLVRRTGGGSSEPKTYVLEFGLSGSTDIAGLRIELAGPTGMLLSEPVDQPRMWFVPLALAPGENKFVLRVVRPDCQPTPAASDGPSVLLQSLSLELQPNPRMPQGDPGMK